ncbi:AAA family ATPase [Variovorax sp. J22R133]|uniref:bifunctional aminoglycoside phosphotransferase/ATP-binding protein n=1 Tax=Variovorax brevis TaxID=3053503 RepID=UPI0025790CB9|nr:bifunctional aminoglycoside phosphotransferase/ATP-binding protein [Variovorax sp. J22R133]MDM0116344.1 AAA family ATPase [Variovorax sp. J22R133]
MVQTASMEEHASIAPDADRTLVDALRLRLEADSGQPVRLVETHISWVLLTATRAYKLKKPVRLSFVDFTTLAARKHFCDEEVRLNRVLAPDLYLGVEPVCGSRDVPHIRGVGEPIDHVVCMKRFPDGALLGELLAAGQLAAAELDALARRLASFHANAPVADSLSLHGAPEQVGQSVMNALDQLDLHGNIARIAPLRCWVVQEAQRLHMAWLQRQRNGAVRECHGDLHLANVVRVDGEWLPFDRIEFDPALRWIDVMSDVAFLVMDLKAHGRADLAFRFLDVYLQHRGDHGGLTVLRFYEVYRALVRALVASLRKGPPAGCEAPMVPDYLACAEGLVRSAGAPRLLITHGFSGSGKSTVAGQLLEVAGAIRIRSDVERKRLFGLGVLERSAARGLDIYTPEATRRTFARLCEVARIALQAGYPVILDAAFLRHAERVAFRALAASLRVPFAILDVRAQGPQLRHRLAARQADASEADLEVLERQLAFHEALDADELAVTIAVDTQERVDAEQLLARWLAVR